MPFIIPSGLVDQYNEHIDAIIDFNGVDVILVFPPAQVECPNCIYSSVTDRSTGIYKTGGPYPFTDNDTCPYCNGVGLILNEQTQTIKMNIYFDPKDFLQNKSAGFRQVNIDQTFLMPEGILLTKCHIQHLPKIEQAIELRVHNAVTAYKTWTYERIRESVPHGFKSDRYILTYWKRK